MTSLRILNKYHRELINELLLKHLDFLVNSLKSPRSNIKKIALIFVKELF